ncbi:MAG TPA: pyrroloquinoline quinone biosynthesis protein PqqB [Gemmatimonadales bacterium]|nr:pyrroloquinoline quinone biosynthesis protein PqqB [Gemmatimonadales bacterium]
MRIILLGTAAGGGFPQWNCWCPTCRAAREEPHRALPRTQSSAAVSADGERWFLLNASPDVRQQLSCVPGPLRTDVRHVPIEGVALTDAELDHTLGILLLREARSLQLYATNPVRAILEQDSRILPVTRAFANTSVTPLPVGDQVQLCYRDGSPSGLFLESFLVPAGPPRFASGAEPGHTTGFLIRDATDGSCAFVPGCGELTASLLEYLNTVDVLLFDGTFWRDEELIDLGISNRTARAMDHLPVSGAHGSLMQLAELTVPHKVYTHINNTNPMLLEDSSERAAVEQAGVTVGSDGMSFLV